MKEFLSPSSFLFLVLLSTARLEKTLLRKSEPFSQELGISSTFSCASLQRLSTTSRFSLSVEQNLQQTTQLPYQRPQLKNMDTFPQLNSSAPQIHFISSPTLCPTIITPFIFDQAVSWSQLQVRTSLDLRFTCNWKRLALEVEAQVQIQKQLKPLRTRQTSKDRKCSLKEFLVIQWKSLKLKKKGADLRVSESYCLRECQLRKQGWVSSAIFLSLRISTVSPDQSFRSIHYNRLQHCSPQMQIGYSILQNYLI